MANPNACVTRAFTEIEIATAIDEAKKSGPTPSLQPSTRISRVIAQHLLKEKAAYGAHERYLRALVTNCTTAHHFDDNTFGVYVDITRRLLQNRRSALTQVSSTAAISRPRLSLRFTGAHAV